MRSKYSLNGIINEILLLGNVTRNSKAIHRKALICGFETCYHKRVFIKNREEGKSGVTFLISKISNVIQ